MISIIVAMGRNRVIGRAGGLPWKCRADLRRFKHLTMGHHCIVGRKTYESLPPLPGRKLIVVTRQRGYDAPLVADSVEEAWSLVPNEDHEPFVIGGAEIYQQALPMAGRIYLTTIHGDYEGDAYFPMLQGEWQVSHMENHEDHDFTTLKRTCNQSTLSRVTLRFAGLQA